MVEQKYSVGITDNNHSFSVRFPKSKAKSNKSDVISASISFLERGLPTKLHMSLAKALADHLGDDFFFLVRQNIDHDPSWHIMPEFLGTKRNRITGNHPGGFHLLDVRIDGDAGHGKFVRHLRDRHAGIPFQKGNDAGVEIVHEAVFLQGWLLTMS